MSRRLALCLLLLLVPLLAWSPPRVRAEPGTVTVYYNQACGDCLSYVKETLLPLLEEAGYPPPIYHDYINQPSTRQELLARSDALGVPPSLQSHLTIFVGDRLILEGHIPAQVVGDLLASPPDAVTRLLVYQDKMNGATEYVAWGFRGQPITYQIGTPIATYLAYLAENAGSLAPAPLATTQGSLLPLVLATGFLDGLNPCAFAVMLFLIAFLFTMRWTTARVGLMGLVYIAAIYAAYLLIGLGLMRAVLFVNDHHLMAKIGAWLLIALGLINVKDYVAPELPLHLRIPTIAHGTIQSWLKRGTFPAAAVGGFLVGLCTFPCSGGIYVAIVGLLAAKATQWQGVGYLALYNLAFVLPLILILLSVSNRRMLHYVRIAETSGRRAVRLLTGLGMVVLGAVILLFFV